MTAELKTLVERIERLHGERDAIASDVADVYLEAKGRGYVVPALKVVIARRRKDPDKLTELDGLVETYQAALGSGTEPALRAARVHAHKAVSSTNNIASLPVRT